MVKKQHSFSWQKFIASMKFGMILLLILAGYSTLGTLIPQERPLGFYEENYSGLVFSLIRIFQLHKVYSAVYFIVLTLLFSANLIFCSLRRLPGTIRLYKRDLHIDSLLKKEAQFEIPLEGIDDSKVIFPALGYRKFDTVEVDGKSIAYATRRRLGYFGSYFVHLGILVVILALASGKLFGYETYLSGGRRILLSALVMITGAIWAEQAWSRYWAWDPKETWSFITWIIYSIYLHLRITRGWRGKKAALFAVIGFICVLFTYIGVNTLLPSIHSYALESLRQIL